MKLNFVYGRAGTGKTEACLAAIRQELRKSPEGTPLLLLVPEHATFKLERELASTSDLGGFTRAYVMGFRRFSHRVLLEVGGALSPRITDLGKRLLIRKILSDKSQEFSAFARAARQRNFTETLVKLIEEFKSYQIEAAQLSEVSATVQHKALQQKLADLSLVYCAFSEHMAGRYTDAEDCLQLLAEKLAQTTLVQGAKVWIDGFTWFNPQELAIIKALLTSAAEVTITLCMDDIESLQHQQEIDLFHRQWKTRQTVLELAKSLDIEVRESELPTAYRFGAQAELAGLERYLATGLHSPITENGAVVIAEAANRRKEIEGVAVDMIRLCREQQYRWRDIAVLVRDEGNYGNLMERVFTDMKIPFFRDGKRQGVHHPLAEFLRSVIEALQGWRYEPLFRTLKTGFFAATRAELDIVENYVLMYGIHGAKWQEEWQYGRKITVSEERLALLNDVRLRLIAPLNSLKMRLQQGQTVSAYTNALYDALEELEIPKQLADLAIVAEQAGRMDEAREYEQLWNSTIGLFEQLVETCGEERMTLTDYHELLNDGLEGLALNLIPPSLDYVTITTIEQNTSENAKAIYIVGVNEGVLPKRGRTEGLLNDAERLLINECGLHVAPGAGSDNFAERFLVYSALTRAREYLWLSYPLADGEGNGLLPSTLIGRVRNHIGASEKNLPLELPDAQSILPFIGEGRQAVTELTGSLRRLMKTGELNEAWRDVYNWAIHAPQMENIMQISLAGLFYTKADAALPIEIARALYAKQKYLRGSVTRFEKFTACPFRYFSEYGLKLKERVLYQLQSFDIGKFLHDVLRRYGEGLLQEGRLWQEVPIAEQKARCAEIIKRLKEDPAYMVLQSSAQNRNLLVRITKTAEFSIERLSRFAEMSAFKPQAFEQSFGLVEGELPPLTYPLEDGYRLSLTGQIDRIDCVEVDGNLYYLVMDYKTGQADIELIDVFYGLKLQLLTYLLAVQTYAQSIFSREALPAAMLYCFLTIPFITETKKIDTVELKKAMAKKGKMPGWALADVEIMEEIDRSFADDFGFIRFGVKKNHEFTKATLPNVKDSEEFQTLIAYVGDKFTQIGKRILSGEVAVNPYQLKDRNACTYCPYGAICRFDQSLSCYQYQQLPMLDDAAIMQKISEEGTNWAGQRNN